MTRQELEDQEQEQYLAEWSKKQKENCPYLKVGERVPNLIIDDTQEQLRFA